MTREEEIKKAVQEFIEERKTAIGRAKRGGWYFANIFEEGIKWTDEHPKCPWVNTKEDLPCNHEELIIRHDDLEILEVKHVLVHYKNGDFGIRQMWKIKDEPWKWHPNTSDIDYWMLIPELPKE